MPIRSRIDYFLQRFEKTFDVYNQISISRAAILHNYDLLKKLSPNEGYVFPVLKSNAYGHGLEQITKILKSRKFPYIAVDGYFEALAIQTISHQPVLVMGSIRPQNFPHMSFKNIAVVANELDSIRALAMTNKHIKVHLELETGMHRHGLPPNRVSDALELFKTYHNIELDGVMTHLADADNPKDSSFTKEQVKLFDNVVEQILASDLKPKYFHIANSAGSTKVSSKYVNAIRPGLALYGISPLEISDNPNSKLAKLKPALELTSTITKAFDIKAGDSVSYGRTFVAKENMRIGVLPLGYYEALPRELSSSGLVEWENNYLPVVGRICMNHTMIDLETAGPKIGDNVIVISNNPASKVSLANICRRHNLFSYEFLTNLSSSIRRVISD